MEMIMVTFRTVDRIEFKPILNPDGFMENDIENVIFYDSSICRFVMYVSISWLNSLFASRLGK